MPRDLNNPKEKEFIITTILDLFYAVVSRDAKSEKILWTAINLLSLDFNMIFVIPLVSSSNNFLNLLFVFSIFS